MRSVRIAASGRWSATTAEGGDISIYLPLGRATATIAMARESNALTRGRAATAGRANYKELIDWLGMTERACG